MEKKIKNKKKGDSLNVKRCCHECFRCFLERKGIVKNDS